MPLNGTEKYKNRVLVSCVVTGTADYSTFTTIPTNRGITAFADGDRFVYDAVAVDAYGNPTGTDFEVGVGVVGTSGTVITRSNAEILDSSNAGARVSWAASSLVRVACIMPAQQVAIASSNGTIIKTASQNLTGTAYQDVTDLTVNLPVAGTYFVSLALYAAVAGTTNPNIDACLNLNGTDVTDSNYIVVLAPGSGTAVGTGTRDFIVTASGAHTLKVRAKRGGATWTVSYIATDAIGKSSMTWFRMY